MTSFEWGMALLACACLIALVLLTDTKKKVVAALGVIAGVVALMWRRKSTSSQKDIEPPLTPDPEPKHRETDAKIRQLDEGGTVYLDVPHGVDMAKLNRLRARLKRRRREGLPDNQRSRDAD